MNTAMENSSVRVVSEPMYLRVRDVAQRLSISRAMVYKLIREGKLPSVRINSVILIPRGSLDELVCRK